MKFVFALIGYPILNYIFDHFYPYSPTFGLSCPTVIFHLWIIKMDKIEKHAHHFINSFVLVVCWIFCSLLPNDL